GDLAARHRVHGCGYSRESGYRGGSDEHCAAPGFRRRPVGSQRLESRRPAVASSGCNSNSSAADGSVRADVERAHFSTVAIAYRVMPDPEDKLAAPWRESAARLVQLLESTADTEVCLAVLNQLNRRFGEQGYPGFLKLLLTVAESSHARARQRLADCIALGLRRGDAPSGVLTSWGAT